jgi:hypothetical protein
VQKWPAFGPTQYAPDRHGQPLPPTVSISPEGRRLIAPISAEQLFLLSLTSPGIRDKVLKDPTKHAQDSDFAGPAKAVKKSLPRLHPEPLYPERKEQMCSWSLDEKRRDIQ